MSNWTPRRHPRRPITALALVIACACALTAMLTTSAVAGARHPRMTMEQMAPATVQGHGFAPRRFVRLTLTANGRMTRLVRANRYGSFTVRFATDVSRCNFWMINARQAPHTNLTVRSHPPIDCAPL